MATVISAEKMRGGGYGVRASINNHVFVEAEKMRGGGYALDGKVGTGAEVLVVDGWTPDDDDIDVDHGHSVLVDLHAVGTNELDVLYDSDADFETGTHDDTKATGDALTLVTSPFTEDWEGVSPLDDWSTRLTTGGGSQYITTDGDSKVLYMVNWNDNQCMTPDNGPDSDDQIVRTDMKFNTANINGFAGPAVRLTGSGSALRGYFFELRYNSNQIRVDRITGEGSWAYVNQVSGPFYFTTGTWYTIMMRASGQGIWYKAWRTETENEPASWTWCATHSSYTTGETGIYTRSGSENSNWHFDNYAAESEPPAYAASGEWESGELDTTSVGNYSHALVTWDETLPTDTTAAVKCRWRTWDAWAACTNGAELPGIDRGKAMVAGTPYDSLELQVALATTDDSATPEVSNLRVYFEPVAEGGLEVDLGGDYQCTVANGLLEYWHRNHVSGGAVVLDWGDIKIQTRVPRWYLGPGQDAAVTLKYGGDTIDSISLAFARDSWLEASPLTGFYWGLTPLVYASAPIQARWNARHDWAPTGHVYEWVLIDKNIAMHADVSWLCGHYQLDDAVGSLVAAALELGDHPGSLLAEGHKLDDHHGQLLAQAWRRNDQPGMLMPSVETLSDHCGFLVVAVRQLSDHPGSFLARGVNSDGMIEVSIIDADAWAELVARGYSRG